MFLVRFGNETLHIDSCRKKLLYDLVCRALRGGMNAHLKTNLVLRDWFDLGPAIAEIVPVKINKPQRVMCLFCFILLVAHSTG